MNVKSFFLADSLHEMSRPVYSENSIKSSAAI